MNRLWRVLLTPLRLTEPNPLPSETYWNTVWAVLLLAVSLGLQATVLAMIVVGPLAPTIPPETLTRVGQVNVRSEWDLPAFYAGCLVTVVLCFAAVRLWNARLRRDDAARAAFPGAALHALLGIASAWAFVALASSARAHIDPEFRLPAEQAWRLCGPSAAAVAVLAVYYVRSYVGSRGS